MLLFVFFFCFCFFSVGASKKKQEAHCVIFCFVFHVQFVFLLNLIFIGHLFLRCWQNELENNILRVNISQHWHAQFATDAQQFLSHSCVCRCHYLQSHEQWQLWYSAVMGVSFLCLILWMYRNMVALKIYVMHWLMNAV